MKITQFCWDEDNGWDNDPLQAADPLADVIFVFGATKFMADGECIAVLQRAFPDAQMIGCSTAGEISGTIVSDNRLVATVINFRTSRVVGASVFTPDHANGIEATKALVDKFPRTGLRHLFLLSDGLLINGSDIIRGLYAMLPEGFPVTGGLAGDGMDFAKTYVVFNGRASTATIAAIGFYGDNITIGCGSSGGWVPFGPERLITRSRGNILSELDGQSALELYKQYLGKYADRLPAAGLHFPLSIVTEECDEAVVRTILFVDEKNQSLGFAGDVPTGSYARFMRAVPDDLIDGAANAALISKTGGQRPELCILISCAGRKAVLKQLTEEETESVAASYSHPPILTGFYSYGEIAPFRPGDRVILHNQTMTITTISEE